VCIQVHQYQALLINFNSHSFLTTKKYPHLHRHQPWVSQVTKILRRPFQGTAAHSRISPRACGFDFLAGVRLLTLDSKAPRTRSDSMALGMVKLRFLDYQALDLL
jgi:hypothetical protein